MEDLVAEMQGLFPEWQREAGFSPTAKATDNEPEGLKKAEAYFRNLWAKVQLRNDGATLVGVSFRPFAATLRDTVESLIEVCETEPRLVSETKARL